MKSYAHQDLSRKRIKKLAARLSDGEIRAWLSEDEDNIAFIYERPGEEAEVMYWDAFSGPMVIMSDDSVFPSAAVDYLRRRGSPIFHSDDEIRSYAARHGWPHKSRSGDDDPVN